MKDNFGLLRTKQIISVLDGDTPLEEKENENDALKMPYLSGTRLCELSGMLGFYQEYSNLSRWMYLDNLLEYSIKENKVSKLLSYLFSMDNFSKTLNNLPNVREIKERHKRIVELAIDKINSYLCFGGHELVKAGNDFIIKGVNEEIKIETPRINIIDREYIKTLSERALKDIEDNNLDSAITKARTILEETFCYVIEKKQQNPSDSGDIGKLYKQVKDLYNMHTDSGMDKRINKLLSGLENIVQSIAELRNNGSDSHGLGNKRVNILQYHARLAVNAATVMAEFILSVSNEQC